MKETVYIFVTRIPSKLFQKISTLVSFGFFLTSFCSLLTCGWWFVSVRSLYVFNLKSLLHTILVGWKLCTLHFQTQIGISRFSLSNRKNSFFSDDTCTHVMPDVDVRIWFSSTIFRMLLVVHAYVLVYAKNRERKLKSLFERRAGRGNLPRIESFPLGFFFEFFFQQYPVLLLLTSLECN